MYKRLISLTLGLLFALAVHARTAVDLFRADIPVASEDKQLKASDARRALAQVLIRITGNSELMRQPDVQQALKQASRLVFRFRFYRKTNTETGQVDIRAEVGFDPGGIRRLVRDLSLPWWGEQRPELLWVVVQEQGGLRSLVNEEMQPLLGDGLQTARERGLPLTLPLLDLLDQQQLSAIELWGGFTESLDQATNRYGNDGWLLLRLEPLGQAWRARWMLSLPGSTSTLYEQWQRIDNDLGALLAHGIDHATTLLAAREAIRLSEAESGDIILRVTGLNNLQAWLQLEQWLKQQAWSESLQLQHLHQGRATLRLRVTTDPRTVEQALSSSGLLQPVTDQSGGPVWSWIQP